MKPTILIYCGEDGEAGKALAAPLRDGTSHVLMCAASAFSGVQRHADRIVFTNDVPQRLKDTISAAHGFPADAPERPKHRMSDRIVRVDPIKRPRGRPRKAAA